MLRLHYEVRLQKTPFKCPPVNHFAQRIETLCPVGIKFVKESEKKNSCVIYVLRPFCAELSGLCRTTFLNDCCRTLVRAAVSKIGAPALPRI